MAKKITFLLVMMFVLLIASVTAFAAGTESTTTEVSSTQDKTKTAGAEATTKEAVEIAPGITVKDLETKYNEVFFAEDSQSTTQIIDIKYGREYSIKNELRHVFTGWVKQPLADLENPVVMLMYIKIDGKYVPLNDVDTGTNVDTKISLTESKVDLAYLGSNKVNEIRIFAFRKKDVSQLKADENLQITNFKITVRPWNPIEKLFIGISEKSGKSATSEP